MRKIIIRCAAIIGLSLLFATSIQAASTVTFYHHDALGSIIAKSDQDGFMSFNEEYQPYGEKIYGTEDSVSDNEDWYTGKNYSKELDLTYFGARWYDAKQGRFLSMDPAPVSLASIHSFNRYHYANNNPYAYLDPDGERAIIAIRGFVSRSVGQIKAGFSQFKGARSTPFGPSSPLAKMLQRENIKGGVTKRTGKELTPYDPPNRGFLGKSQKTVLQPGRKVDRYGFDGGTFVAPKGTPGPMRALYPGSTQKPYSVFEVRKPITVDGGPSVPAFGQIGLGVQYELPRSVNSLLKSGALKRVVK